MIKKLKYLILIRFRKILPKDDYLAIVLLLLFYVVVCYFLNKIFLKYTYLFVLSTLELVFYHQNREDLDLLKVSKNYKFLLIMEYLIYSFPFLLIYIVNNRFDIFLIHLSILALLILIFKKDYKTFKYPFKLFDPFWHICFRKNKFVLFIPLVVILNILGNKYNNENLNISTLLIVAIIGCVPSFKREELIHLKATYFDSKKYLLKQIQVVLINTFMISSVLVVCFIVFKQWDLLLFIPLVFLFPVISILFKYSFFVNPLLQQIFFVFFVGTVQIGLPFLILPFLYYKSIRTINNLQNVRDSY
ncbi:hypothetical protein [Flavobacterium sp. FlaQc-48]|uniref:hypothetical protein n=1 Tax=Flavobacterium sp. FlaQc-48 TaxID=3374181 RepID=UPI003756395B